MKWAEILVQNLSKCCGGSKGPLPRPEWEGFDKSPEEREADARAAEWALHHPELLTKALLEHSDVSGTHDGSVRIQDLSATRKDVGK